PPWLVISGPINWAFSQFQTWISLLVCRSADNNETVRANRPFRVSRVLSTCPAGWNGGAAALSLLASHNCNVPFSTARNQQPSREYKRCRLAGGTAAPARCQIRTEPSTQVLMINRTSGLK